MMKKIFSIGCAMALALLFGGCAYLEISRNLEQAEQLRVGMTKTQVLAIMGEPLQEPYSQNDVWFYLAQVRWFDGVNTQDECMPLVFENDVLVGWGNEYWARRRLIKPTDAYSDHPVNPGKKGQKNTVLSVSM